MICLESCFGDVFFNTCGMYLLGKVEASSCCGDFFFEKSSDMYGNCFFSATVFEGVLLVGSGCIFDPGVHSFTV